MFSGLKSFVNDLEAVAQQTQQRVASPSNLNTSHSSTSSASRTVSGAASDLAENALLGLRKSFKSQRTPKNSLDSPRASIDIQRNNVARPASPATASPSKPLISAPAATPFAIGTSGLNTPNETDIEYQVEWIPLPPDPPIDAAPISIEELERVAAIPLPLDEDDSSVTPQLVPVEIIDLFIKHTPLQKGLLDQVAVEQFLLSHSKLQEQIRNMQKQIDNHNDRIEEFRDTHRLEIQSMSAEINTLKTAAAAHQSDLVAAQAQVKEEEEKRTKSVSLLKALRQKLVKAEAAKDEAEKISQAERDSLKMDRSKMENEVMAIRADKEGQINKLRVGFERELNSVKSSHERELAARKGQSELDAVTTKAAHSRELTLKETRLKEVENRMVELEKERDALFEEAQMKTAEVESVKTWSNTLESRTTEQGIEIKSLQDRLDQLVSENADLLKQISTNSQATTSEEARQAQMDIEANYKNRISGLESKIKALERERASTEAEMSKNMEQRLSEVERMRREMSKRDLELEAGMKEADQRKLRAESAEAKVLLLEERAKGLEELIESIRVDAAKSVDRHEAIREELTDRNTRIQELESRLEDLSNRESQARSTNKNLRDELRKVQNGVLMAERARNPGVGYFSSFSKDNANGSSSPISEVANSPTDVRPSLSNEGKSGRDEEQAVNFEYIRNVILQFMENKEMRPHLVSVLGVILHFTPQEIRRISQKVAS